MVVLLVNDGIYTKPFWHVGVSVRGVTYTLGVTFFARTSVLCISDTEHGKPRRRRID